MRQAMRAGKAWCVLPKGLKQFEHCCECCVGFTHVSLIAEALPTAKDLDLAFRHSLLPVLWPHHFEN